MVKGLDLFRAHFREHQDSFVLIGGAACENWFTRQGLAFRKTEDLDIVVIVEMLHDSFIPQLWQFVETGGYQTRRRSESGTPRLYRFEAPREGAFPKTLEFFCRRPEGLDLGELHQAIPVLAGSDDTHSLSALLLDDDYYELVRHHVEVQEGIPFATATALIPLKGYAWLDLTERRSKGETVKTTDLKKHRSDVFKLAATLPGTPGPLLPARIQTDLSTFLSSFPLDSGEWTAILDSLRETFPRPPNPASLIGAIRSFYQLS